MASKVSTQLAALKGITLKQLASPEPKVIASEALWAKQPALVFVVRRLGCQLCRNHAQLLSQEAPVIEKELGINMVAVTHQTLDAAEFQKDYWKHDLFYDEQKGFYKALGGGDLRLGKWSDMISAKFWKNIADGMRSSAKGNFKGEAMVLGGLYIVAPGEGGVKYEWIERVAGDRTDPKEIVEVCRRIVSGGKDTAPQN